MENNDRPRPVVLAFAGPNGSGKSTITAGVPIVGAYVNADDIKKQLGVSEILPTKNIYTRVKLLAIVPGDFLEQYEDEE
jgi:predicted ABC-type ATPase